MTVRVLLFGHYRDALPGASTGDTDSGLTVEIPDAATVTDLAAALAARYPRLGDLISRTRPAVRAEFATAETVLCHDDEVAFLPPMSGG